MKDINGIKYTEYGTEEAGDFTATVRVKVNPYVAGVFARVAKESLREICCDVSDRGDGIIEMGFVEAFPFNAAIDVVAKKTDIKYQFITPEED